jgi:protein TonB
MSRRAASVSLTLLLALLLVVAGMIAAGLSVTPATAGTPRLQVFFSSDFTDVPYQQAVYKKVAGAWQRPAEAPKPGSKAVVIATIRKDGTVSAPALHMKSGSEAWDAAAVEAIRKASPFDPLPKAYRLPSVEVHFHFVVDK